MVVLHALQKYGHEMSIWLEIARPLQSYSHCESHHISSMTNKRTSSMLTEEGRRFQLQKASWLACAILVLFQPYLLICVILA